MEGRKEINLREAFNAVSDVVQNRPRPLRELDQIYMKTGDMLLQCELVAQWADKKRLVFIGDGDAISVCVSYLMHRKILDCGPTNVTVFDFDERICSAITRFADKERIMNLSARLYNCLEAFPATSQFDCFYTNPPWGASNDGASINVFAQRGMEAVGYKGEGMIVMADDHHMEWPQRVLHSVQKFVLGQNFYVQKMASMLHQYHLDDNPELRSCNLMVKSLPSAGWCGVSEAIIDPERQANFYGRKRDLRIKYVRERKRVDYGKAHDDEYEYEDYKE